MFFGWLRGIIGSLFFWLGWVFFIFMCYVVGSQDLELNSVILTLFGISILLIAIGSYLRYVSKQTVKKSKIICGENLSNFEF